MREIKDLVFYLQEMEKLSERLGAKQTEELRRIIESILILLVALRRDSHLGEQSINFLEG